jgi:hypothetical protein
VVVRTVTVCVIADESSNLHGRACVPRNMYASLLELERQSSRQQTSLQSSMATRSRFLLRGGDYFLHSNKLCACSRHHFIMFSPGRLHRPVVTEENDR